MNGNARHEQSLKSSKDFTNIQKIKQNNQKLSLENQDLRNQIDRLNKEVQFLKQFSDGTDRIKLISKDQFVREDKIKKGSFATTYMGNLQTQNTVQKVVIKNYKFQLLNDVLIEVFHDWNLLIQINQDANKKYLQVPDSINYEIDDRSLQVNLISELCEHGDLQEYSEVIPDQFQTEEFKLGVAISVLQGLIALHENQIVHSNLRPKNIIMNKEAEARISDFLFFRTIQVQMQNQHTYDARYSSPELLAYKWDVVSQKSDIWSFGCLLYYLYTGRDPWKGFTDQ